MTRKETPAISVRGRKAFWWLVKWGLLAAVIAVAVGVPYFYRQIDHRLRTKIEALLAEQYPHLKVGLRSVELVQDSHREGILLRGVSLAEPDGDSWTPLAECEEVFLTCPTDWTHLAKGQVPIHRILIRRPTLYLRRSAEGNWNFPNLQPKTPLGQEKPELLVEEGTVVLSVATAPSARPIMVRDVQVLVSPSPLAPQNQEEALRTPDDSSDLRWVRTSLSAQGLQHLEMEGWVDLTTHNYAFQGKVENWELTSEWEKALPEQWVEKWKQVDSLQGQVDLTFQAAHRVSLGEPIQFEISGRLTNGRLHDSRLPYPLTDIWAVFRVNMDGVRVEQLLARHGSGTVRLTARLNGYRAGSPMHLEAELRQVELRREWLDVLGLDVRLGRQWDQYRPSGQVHIHLVLDYDGQHWYPEATVECLDVSCLYAKFPYRLDHGRGRLELRNDSLYVQLEAFSENQPVRIAAQILHPLTQPHGWVEIHGQNLPIDQKVFDALNEPTRRLLAPLHPQGTVNAVYRWRCDQPGAVPYRQILLQLNRVAICYDAFPYPIRNLRGTLEAVNDRWEFWGLTGSNGSAHIQGYGHLIPCEQPMPSAQGDPGPLLADEQSFSGATHPAQSVPGLPEPNRTGLFQSIFSERKNPTPPMEFYLHLVAEKVPLEEELRDALPTSAQRLWNQLRPTGHVNLRELEIRYRTGQPSAQVRFSAEPIPASASIEPVSFPYRLEKLQGTIFFAQDQMVWEGFRAEHGAMRVAADVFGRFQPDGAWKLVLENLFIDRLTLDREITKALPDRLKKIFAALNPEGAVGLSGRWELAQEAEPTAVQSSQWDVGLSLVGVRLNPGILLENIHGGVRLVGHFNSQDYQSWGELELDSLIYQGCQFTQIRGPFWIDGQYVLFGPDADARRQNDPTSGEATSETTSARSGRLLTGQLFGGQTSGQGWIRLNAEPEFALRATLADADLARIAQEHLPGIQHLQGRVYGWMYLHGHGRTLHTLSGRGSLHLREADIYELPLMIALLKVLNLRRPDKNAFSDCDLDYRIAGSHIYLDRIVFQGDAISLQGAGETNFQGELHLGLSPLLGREDRKSFALKQFLGGAGQEFMVIRITGTVHDPKTEKQVFPTLNQALQNLTGNPSGQRRGSAGQRLASPIRRLPPKPSGGLLARPNPESPWQTESRAEFP